MKKNVLETGFGQKMLRRLSTRKQNAARRQRERNSYYHHIYPEKSILKKRFFNVGAGAFVHPYWTNIDHPSQWYENVQSKDMLTWDLLSLEPVNIESKSAEIVYTSHTLEHVTNKAAENFFKEAFRILKKGSVLRVTLPDCELSFQAYTKNDRHFFNQYHLPNGENALNNDLELYDIFLGSFATSTSMLWSFQGDAPKISKKEFETVFKKKSFEQAMNYCTNKTSLEIQRKCPGNHINWWTKKKMMQFIQKAGFKTIYESAYGQSHFPVLRDVHYFDNTKPLISLYIEAIK